MCTENVNPVHTTNVLSYPCVQKMLTQFIQPTCCLIHVYRKCQPSSYSQRVVLSMCTENVNPVHTANVLSYPCVQKMSTQFIQPTCCLIHVYRKCQPSSYNQCVVLSMCTENVNPVHTANVLSYPCVQKMSTQFIQPMCCLIHVYRKCQPSSYNQCVVLSMCTENVNPVHTTNALSYPCVQKMSTQFIQPMRCLIHVYRKCQPSSCSQRVVLSMCTENVNPVHTANVLSYPCVQKMSTQFIQPMCCLIHVYRKCQPSSCSQHVVLSMCTENVNPVHTANVLSYPCVQKMSTQFIQPMCCLIHVYRKCQPSSYNQCVVLSMCTENVNPVHTTNVLSYPCVQKMSTQFIQPMCCLIHVYRKCQPSSYNQCVVLSMCTENVNPVHVANVLSYPCVQKMSTQFIQPMCCLIHVYRKCQPSSYSQCVVLSMCTENVNPVHTANVLSYPCVQKMSTQFM